MRESVPTAIYSPVCNVLRQWKTSLILTYRVYRLYDSINVLSKYSSLISHRPSIFEGGHIDLRRSTHQSPIFEGRHINHRSSKVDTSIIDLRRSTHRDIDLRRAIHRSSKVTTSIFESRHIDFRRSKAETSHLQFVTEYCPQLPSKSLE